MKRDMDLVREILLYAEAHSTPDSLCPVTIDGRSPGEISYHLTLVAEAGLLDVIPPGKHTKVWAVRGMTWQGHEFLDAARSQSVWNSAKKLFKAKGIALSFDIGKAVLLDIAKRELLG